LAAGEYWGELATVDAVDRKKKLEDDE